MNVFFCSFLFSIVNIKRLLSGSLLVKIIKISRFTNDRRSPPEVFLRKVVLKICSKFTGDHPCRSVISIEFARHGCSPVDLLHILRTPFPKNTSGRLLLVIKTKEYSYYFKGSFDEIQSNGLYSYKAMM